MVWVTGGPSENTHTCLFRWYILLCRCTNTWSIWLYSPNPNSHIVQGTDDVVEWAVGHPAYVRLTVFPYRLIYFTFFVPSRHIPSLSIRIYILAHRHASTSHPPHSTVFFHRWRSSRRFIGFSEFLINDDDCERVRASSTARNWIRKSTSHIFARIRIQSYVWVGVGWTSVRVKVVREA